VFRGETDDVSSLIKKHRAWEHDEGISTFSDHRGECPVELVGPLYRHELKLKSQGLCGRARRVQHVARRALSESTGMALLAHQSAMASTL
jgi:hypothetical protein